MLPFLQFLADGKEHTLGEAEQYLAAHFGLTSAERAEMLPRVVSKAYSETVSAGHARILKKQV